jgi:hypothetical protein
MLLLLLMMMMIRGSQSRHDDCLNSAAVAPVSVPLAQVGPERAARWLSSARQHATKSTAGLRAYVARTDFSALLEVHH